jgi:cadmium resistance protein CadD (predicted permease)
MTWLISEIILGFTAFASTNIDDLFVLMLFFSQVDKNFRARHIIIGQYIGIGVLIVLGLIGSLSTSLFPRSFIGLMGVFPIVMGIIKLTKKQQITSEDFKQKEEVISSDKTFFCIFN